MAGNGAREVLRVLDRLRGGAVRTPSSYLAFMIPSVVPARLYRIGGLGGRGRMREGRRRRRKLGSIGKRVWRKGGLLG